MTEDDLRMREDMTEHRGPRGRGFRIILNIIIAALAIGAWLMMVFIRGGLLTDRGLRSLRYFTVLSNLFEGIACIIWIVTAISAAGTTGLRYCLC